MERPKDINNADDFLAAPMLDDSRPSSSFLFTFNFMTLKPGTYWIAWYECREAVVYISPKGDGFFAIGQEELWPLSCAEFIEEIPVMETLVKHELKKNGGIDLSVFADLPFDLPIFSADNIKQKEDRFVWFSWHPMYPYWSQSCFGGTTIEDAHKCIRESFASKEKALYAHILVDMWKSVPVEAMAPDEVENWHMWKQRGDSKADQLLKE